MTVYSTRNRIRVQLVHAMADIDRVLSHLQKADEISEGGHPRLSEFLPSLVLAFDEMKKVLTAFRDEI